MRYLFPLILAVLLFSCSPGQGVPDQAAARPDTLIPRDTMIRIMTDVHLAEAAISTLKSKGGLSKNPADPYYSALFSKYRVSRELFQANFDYYQADQEEFIKMYEEVIKNLDGMQKKSPSEPEE